MKKKQEAATGKPEPQKNRQKQEKAGLTFSEKKRLAELKRILAGNSREQAKPDTAQKTITFKKMYRDGICQVADTYYTKMVEFFDINYDLLEVEDQADILEEYSKLINYFDPSIRFQLFLFNRQVSEQALEIDGYTTKYAHMDSLNVSAGQTVEKGAVIGTTGNTGSSTGSHLHIECLYNGEYYNPLFYFDVGEGTLYGETPGGLPGNAIPPDAYDDASVQALMEEAAKYLGYPYVWGGSSPSTSFDCSGFVCWVFTNSGVHNLPRTTAQGIYDQCTPVSASDAKAGDIIFFTGTYNSAGAVSHVGIYCGNGVMIHCGDPISYASINSPYWQSHFYSFGRLN